MHLPNISPQSAEVYRVLSKSDGLTVRQIAEELHILPNAVYRTVKPLIEFGMAEQMDGYPVRYRAVQAGAAMNWYLRAAAQDFRREFSIPASKQPDDSLPSITFIKDRRKLLQLGEQDARKATKTINYIVSGHRVPDSTVLAYRKAATVGVRIRAITQNNPDTASTATLESYEDMGVEVRYLPDIGIRLFVFDGKTAYLTSYDDTQSNKAFGIRFTYAPVAAQLDQLFEQRWQQAKPLS